MRVSITIRVEEEVRVSDLFVATDVWSWSSCGSTFDGFVSWELTPVSTLQWAPTMANAPGLVGDYKVFFWTASVGLSFYL